MSREGREAGEGNWLPITILGGWKYSLTNLTSKTPDDAKRRRILSKRKKKLLLVCRLVSGPREGDAANLWLLLWWNAFENHNVLPLWKAQRRKKAIKAILCDDSLRNLGKIFKVHRSRLTFRLAINYLEFDVEPVKTGCPAEFKPAV